jgi:hypothetical protein
MPLPDGSAKGPRPAKPGRLTVRHFGRSQAALSSRRRDARPRCDAAGGGQPGTVHSIYGLGRTPVQTPALAALHSKAGQLPGGAFLKMTHPLLFNPFHSKQEHAQEHPQERAREAPRRAAWSTRSAPVCGHCRSDDIVLQATAQWSNEKQEWELANTFAQPAHCNTCSVACEIVWLPLN